MQRKQPLKAKLGLRAASLHGPAKPGAGLMIRRQSELPDR